MNTSRQIQFVLGTILLWSSTAVSSFAASYTINPEKFQSDTVKLPVESTPVRSLNLTPDTTLIAQNVADQISNIARQLDRYNGYIPKFEDALTKPDSKQIILAFCPSQPQDKVDLCWNILQMWSTGKEMQVLDSRNWDLLDKISDVTQAVSEARRQRRGQ
ncbi:MAG TPA: hypothetical protein V6D28_31395 [Leptolyngbyaceae cyanobacterium]